MKIKEQTRKLAAGYSKNCSEVVDKTAKSAQNTVFRLWIELTKSVTISTARWSRRGLKRFSKSIIQKSPVPQAEEQGFFKFQLFFSSKEVFSNKGCKNSTNDWCKDENPNLLKCCATYQYSRSQATSLGLLKVRDVQSS